MKKKPNISGVLPIIKPPGPTSHDAVQVARHALNQRQVGHTGTLDPAAGGVLVLCLGTYTKLVPYLVESGKTYRGFMLLGIETTTDDSEGNPALIADASHATLDRVRAVASRFQGEIEQIPPRYAAIKVAGKKLYEYARAGEEIEAEPRRVTVSAFEIESLEETEIPAGMLERAQTYGLNITGKDVQVKKAGFVVAVSAGTYVRALARDVGRELGCGGYLLSLWREQVGQFSSAQAMPLEQLRAEPECVPGMLIRGGTALDTSKHPLLTILQGFVPRLMRGQPLNEKMMEKPQIAAAVPSGAVCGVASEDGALLAMMEAERFDSTRRANAYDTRFEVHFRPLRIFPEGLR